MAMNRSGLSRTLKILPFLLLHQFTQQQQQDSNSSFSVAVRCSDNAMEMFVQFRKPFNGRLKTRPNGRCFVNGRGRLTVGFHLPLDEKHRRKCSVIRRAEEFIAIVDLEMNPKLVTAEENNASYFVRCPILSTNAQQPAIADERNATAANFSSTDTEMRKLTEIGPSLKLITLDGQGGGQQARLQKCLAISNLAGADGKVRAVPLGNTNECAQQQIEIRPPFLNDQQQQQQQYGKFMLQCEIIIGSQEAQEKLCPNSTIPLGHQLADNAREALQIPPASTAPSVEQLLVAALLGVLLSLCLACLCLVAVHFLGRYRDRNREGGTKFLGALPPSRKVPKRVQIVCPTSHSALSLNSSALSFGSSPILPPPLQCHPPPRSHQHCFSPLSSGASSPTSTVTTALALSLDKLPEPPSLSLAEIRQLNLAFNGLLRNNGSKYNERGNPNTMSGSDASSGVYSFAGIRLNSQFMSDMMDSQSVGDERTEYDKPAKYF